MAIKPSHDVEGEIRALPDLPLDVLKERWHALYRTEPPRRISRNLLVRALAYKIQEQTFGGLKPAVRRRLKALATGQTLPDRIAAGRIRIRPGTRLIREWNGKLHEVTVTDDGFVWNDKRYRSLSAIARAITDTRWNGLVFFGLKSRKQKRARDHG